MSTQRIKDSVQNELNELNQKIKKLSIFLDSEEIKKIDEFQQELLNMQYDAMVDYQSCLNARLKNLKGK